jgi:hypothetical protein
VTELVERLQTAAPAEIAAQVAVLAAGIHVMATGGQPADPAAMDAAGQAVSTWEDQHCQGGLPTTTVVG